MEGPLRPRLTVDHRLSTGTLWRPLKGVCLLRVRITKIITLRLIPEGITM